MNRGMRRMVAISIFIFGISMFFSYHNIPCKGQDKAMVEGKIYYVVSNKMIEMNLATKKERIIYKAEGIQILNCLNVVNDDLFILERRGIEYYDVKKNNFKFITRGISPLYVQEINSIFYYRPEKIELIS